MNRVLPVLLAVLVTFGVVAPAHSALVISIDNVVVGPGFSEVEVDVWIRAASSEVQIAGFDFEFRVTPDTGTIRQLRFLDPQEDRQLKELNYLFFDGSLKRDGFELPPVISLPADFVGNVIDSPNPEDTFIGGDTSTDPFLSSAVNLTMNPRLLARLQFVPGPGTLVPEVDDKFLIELIPGSNTSFSTGSDELPYIIEQGSVTVAEGPVSVIPEPSSLMLWGLGAWVCAMTLRRRRDNEH